MSKTNKVIDYEVNEVLKSWDRSRLGRERGPRDVVVDEAVRVLEGIRKDIAAGTEAKDLYERVLDAVRPVFLYDLVESGWVQLVESAKGGVKSSK